MYRHFRLWFWWNFVIKKDEFSPKLGVMSMSSKYKKLRMSEVGILISRQRSIAHRLDSGENIKDINQDTIKYAKI